MKMSLIGLMVSIGIIATSAVAAPTSYPMQCRGGGSLTIGMNNQSGVNMGYLYFQKAPHKSSLGLQAGQCAWLDRAIGPNEPVCLQQSGVVGSAWMFPNQMQNNYYATTNAEWMRNLLKSEKFITFRAYNPGTGGCFIVTGFN